MHEITERARITLARAWRGWADWPDGHLVLGDTEAEISDIAVTNTKTRAVRVNPTRLLDGSIDRITEQVLLNDSPRLTGVLLHEAAHSRFTRWGERVQEVVEADPALGKPRVLWLASLLEEARCEGRMHRTKVQPLLAPTVLTSVRELVGAPGPNPTPLEALASWVLTSLRLHAWGLPGGNIRDVMPECPDGLRHLSSGTWRLIANWAARAVDSAPDDDPTTLLCDAHQILQELGEVDGPVDPRLPTPKCATGPGQSGEGESGEGESDEGESGEGDGGDGGDEAEAWDAAAEADTALREFFDAVAEAAQEDPEAKAASRGAGEGEPLGGGVLLHRPGATDRAVQRTAESFLRDLIAPTEASRRRITASPSANVDGAALAAWRAKGERGEPRFFVRTQRTVTPAPPVTVGILVDVSSSMTVLQKPSSLLAWALAAAARDLRNYAGRGQQVHYSMVEWGSGVEHVYRDGDPIPGLRDNPCNQGTLAFGAALESLIDDLPALADPDGGNTLLVSFSDYELFGQVTAAEVQMAKVRASGTRVLSVVPTRHGSPYYSGFTYRRIMGKYPAPLALVGYGDNDEPKSVLDAAQRLLR